MKIEEKLPGVFQGINNIADHTDVGGNIRRAALTRIGEYVEESKKRIDEEEQLAIDKMLSPPDAG